MISINAILLDTSEWQTHEATPELKAWVRPDLREMLSLHYFAVAPDIPYALDNINAIKQDMIKNITSAGGEIVLIDVETIQKLKALYQIFKFPMYEDGRGRIYVASFTFPFKDFSFVVKVQSPETGITGQRESFALNNLIQEGSLDLDQLVPADDGSSRMTPEMMQQISIATDKPELDAIFPSHPLSRIRGHLKHIRASIKFDDMLYKATPF